MFSVFAAKYALPRLASSVKNPAGLELKLEVLGRTKDPSCVAALDVMLNTLPVGVASVAPDSWKHSVRLLRALAVPNPVLVTGRMLSDE